MCEAGGEGGFFLPLFGNEFELGWPPHLRALAYFVGLLYAFYGVSILADVFMEAIEEITSQERTVEVIDPKTNQKHTKRVLVWNRTVANLSLMALGTSAPEILLSIVEVIGHGFYAGELGPGTIVGSAAFNFLVIIAVVIVAIPAGEQRRIRSFATFIATAVTSLLAYGWMYVAISVSSPDVIELWEAVVTVLGLPALLILGYHADIGTFGFNDAVEATATLEQIKPPRNGDLAAAAESGGAGGAVVAHTVTYEMGGQMARLMARNKDNGLTAGMNLQQLAQIASADLGLARIKSRAYYRNYASRAATGSRRSSMQSDVQLSHVPGAANNDTADGTDGHLADAQQLRIELVAPRTPRSTPPAHASRRSSVTLAASKVTKAATRLVCCGTAPPPLVPVHPSKSEQSRRDLRSVMLAAAQSERALLSSGMTRSDSPGGGAPVIRLLVAPNAQQGDTVGALWRRQIFDSLVPYGALDELSGELAPPAWDDYVLHAFAFPWKVLCALACPPVSLLGGLVTFLTTLALVGLVTTVISDLASVLGCVLGVPDSVTAITLVAVGTSIPDTFASRIAAINEPTADSSITNVTGSNSVNVFLGLGMPWLFASLYWKVAGPTDDWVSRYADVAARMPEGSAEYVLYGGDLGFSVQLFFIVSLIGMAILLARRNLLGAELGGPPLAKWASAITFFVLWVVYLVIVIRRILVHSSV
jgi:Ca2+/Na+ antiporter